MKICIVHSDPSFPARESIDLWRIIRPFRELEKHVDWQIDHKDYLIEHTLIDEKTNKVPTNKLVEEILKLSKYDIVWTGYFPDAALFDAMLFTQEKFGTKFVLDCDDDFWNIPASNPIWKQDNMDRNIADIKYAITSSTYFTTSSPNLKKFYESLRPDLKTYLLENFIGDYKHKPFDNGNDVVIAFFGGVSHVKDLKVTGFTEAVTQLMKKYPQVRLGSVGLEIKPITGTLKKRYTFRPGIPGEQYVTKLWPNINCDIAVAPLEQNVFNTRKTNIKWQETAMIPAAFVGSRIAPYLGTVTPEVDGVLVRDGVENWYFALEKLVLDKDYRQKLAANAKLSVEKNWSIENNWKKLKDIIDDITNDSARSGERQEI